jgi:hypothetical protein
VAGRRRGGSLSGHTLCDVHPAWRRPVWFMRPDSVYNLNRPRTRPLFRSLVKSTNKLLSSAPHRGTDSVLSHSLPMPHVH